MRIEQIDYWDKETGWTLATTDFFPDLTLLVGVSGVGKTKILRAIRTLKRFVRRSDSPSEAWGVGWRIQFITSGKRYLWEGEFENKPHEGDEAGTNARDVAMMDEDDDVSTGPKILMERLCANEDVLIDRNRDTINFKQQLTPKLSPFKSAVALLKEEDCIKPVVDGFGHIAYLDQHAPQMIEMIPRLESLCKRYQTIADIQESDLSTYVKMAVLFENGNELFRKIVSQFRDVFPLVEEVKFERLHTGLFADEPDLQIKEFGVERWIPEGQISSGMFRTLMHLGTVALWPDESVILIDEFENSMGVNCLDDVTGDMMGHRDRLQFIVTSHHPYIINNIPPKHWKLVTRKAAQVRTIDAAQAGIGRSRHEAFIQLMNNPLYQDGVAAK